MDAARKTGKSCRRLRKYIGFKEKKKIDINFSFFSSINMLFQ